MINCLGTLSLFFTLNPTVVHHPAVSLLHGKEINLHVFYDKNLPNSRDRSIITTMNPKAQTQFSTCHIYIYFLYKKTFQLKKIKTAAFLEIYNLIMDAMKLLKMACYIYILYYGLQMLRIQMSLYNK
jgi:hypothetical protein